MSEERDNIVVLTDWLGEEVRYEFIDAEFYNGDKYVILLPYDDLECEEVVILKSEASNGEGEELVSVEDQETLDIVFGMFREKYKDSFDFADE